MKPTASGSKVTAIKETTSVYVCGNISVDTSRRPILAHFTNYNYHMRTIVKKIKAKITTIIITIT